LKKIAARARKPKQIAFRQKNNRSQTCNKYVIQFCKQAKVGKKKKVNFAKNWGWLRCGRPFFIDGVKNKSYDSSRSSILSSVDRVLVVFWKGLVVLKKMKNYGWRWPLKITDLLFLEKKLVHGPLVLF
jgi:hypothetical protein